MKKIRLLFIVFAILQSCGASMIDSGSKIDELNIIDVDFCDLAQFNGKLIRTQLEYSGFEEYWSANGFVVCPLDNKVNLNFEEYYNNENERKIDKKLLKLGENYATQYAIMKVIGVFKMDTIQGFGHLNTYPAEILVKRVKIEIKEK